MTLRAAGPADVAVVAGLEALLFGADAWSPAAVTEELTGPGRRAVVAVAEEGVVGYAVTLRSGDTVDLQRIGVHPQHQRHGTARALLGVLLERAREDGAEAVLLEVSDRNRPARAFYEREGFTEIARRRRYYRDGADALVLRRPLRATTTGEGE